MAEFFHYTRIVYLLAQGVVTFGVMVGALLVARNKVEKRTHYSITWFALLSNAYYLLFLWTLAWYYADPHGDCQQMPFHLLMSFLCWHLWGREIRLYDRAYPRQPE